ncbi:uncharacterized protein LOC27208078 isoform X2 [Drosophila simulans]|uniref:uncharacterized protein LOC27208078 isoform X2 n=1 Tax=Drosophila simulans TaxID=7240 RepID=UPI00192D10BC|nr:uncharacterized protein LOC27208078 isoform X2 [Drosophila simulans]
MCCTSPIAPAHPAAASFRLRRNFVLDSALGYWVCTSQHLRSVATMTSAAAGKWPLQARHMLLLRPATSAPRKRGASPLQPQQQEQRGGAGSTMFGLPLKVGSDFLPCSAENKQRNVAGATSLNCFSWTLLEFGVGNFACYELPVQVVQYN